MRPVTVGEVVKCASQKCMCRGSGVIRKWEFTRPDTQQRVEQVCACARKRFLKANGEKIVIQGEHDWHWKEEVAA